MPGLHPTHIAIKEAFNPTVPTFTPQVEVSSTAPQPRYIAWSASENAKSLGQKAQIELQKATDVARPKTGQLELYSAQYYAACTLGGLLACVSISCDTHLISEA